ncbi:MAG: glycolate oxidase subunit GlcF [Armatimonadetes bacterium]|nr:glycolate oxidase subunit GlcF [Armatimonadota bacterium]
MKRHDDLLDCVHCGFCLPTCPTYAELGREMDSPRGRLYLMRALADKRLPPGATVLQHLDLCLDCRACESACPSGVKYGSLLEATRAGVARAGARPLRERLVNRAAEWVFPEPARLRRLVGLGHLARRLGVGGLLPRRLREALALLPPRLPHTGALPERTPARGRARLRVAFLEGCAARVLCPEMNAAMVSVLARSGCEVVVPAGQGCCGAIHLHGGSREAARRLARRNVAAFLAEAPDVIVANAAGCGAAMKEYGELLADDPAYAERARALSARVRDFTELVPELPGFTQGLGPLPARATYHDACHLAHAQGIRAQPRRLLAAIPELQLVDLPESDWCCGSAGIYNVTQPGMARRLLERKLHNIERTRADIVVAANPGCLLQIRAGVRERGLEIEVLHPAEVLERSYQAGERP